MNTYFENYEKLLIKYMIVFQVFIKFQSSERNTENTMSHTHKKKSFEVFSKSFAPPSSTIERN